MQVLPGNATNFVFNILGLTQFQDGLTTLLKQQVVHGIDWRIIKANSQSEERPMPSSYMRKADDDDEIYKPQVNVLMNDRTWLLKKLQAKVLVNSYTKTLNIINWYLIL